MATGALVTATIAAYAGGSVVARFVNQGGGSPGTQDRVVTGNIDADGTFSLAVWNNTDPAYKPSQTTFYIYVLVDGVAYQYTAAVTITGNEDISAAFDNAPMPPTPGGGGVDSVFSRTGEVIAQTGDYSASQISGLGTAATVSTGTSGATIPLLNVQNTWSANQTIAGILTTTIVNPSASANATIGLATTGATVSRNVADANPALSVTQTNASSTGNIANFSNNTGVVAYISESGSVVAPFLLSPTSLAIGTMNLNTLVFQTNGTPRWSVAPAPGNFIPVTNGGQTIGDATHQIQNVFSGNVVSVIGARVDSAATIAPTGSIFHIMGTATISTITPPAGFDATHGGSIQFIADAVFAIASGGNIATVIAPIVVGTLYIATWDGTSWYIK